MIDTNVVLDLLHFDEVAARPLRLALEDGRMHCAVSDSTLAEWRRVLAYREFDLDPAQQATLFVRYQALAIKADAVGVDVRLPRCSDPDDQQFIELAAAVRAQGLVSKDRAVLKLRRRCAPLFRVMGPAEAVRWLDGIQSIRNQSASCG